MGSQSLSDAGRTAAIRRTWAPAPTTGTQLSSAELLVETVGREPSGTHTSMASEPKTVEGLVTALALASVGVALTTIGRGCCAQYPFVMLIAWGTHPTQPSAAAIGRGIDFVVGIVIALSRRHP
jgi:hypothetical protein